MSRGLSILASVALILLIAVCFYKDYASLFRNNKELVKSLGPSNSISAMLSYDVHHRMDNLPLVRLGEDAKPIPAMHTPPDKHLTILVVGETSRADNFALSGYPRDTNPLLSKDNVVYFPETTSCGTATAISVPCMFSGMPRKITTSSLRIIVKACWILCSARGYQCSGMKMTAAVKVPVTACRIRI